MAQNELDWEGPAWESHCLDLLRLRYKEPGHFQRIPSRDQGDLGIEGFSIDGCVYQCYAHEGALPTKERYEKQRKKLTTDLKKLVINEVELRTILGTVKIRTYVFMTPIHDSKRLNAHAKTKAAEIRGMDLSICTEDFDIIIHTEADYPVERAEILNLGLDRFRFPPFSSSSQAVDHFINTNPEFLAIITEKLTRIRELDRDEIEQLLKHLVSQKLDADNKLSEIRRTYVDGWERIQSARAIRETSLAVSSILSVLDSRVLLSTTSMEYKQMLLSEFGFLSEEAAEVIAWGTTTDWLAECPLNFRTAGSR